MKHVRNYVLVALGTLVLTCATNAQAGLYTFPFGVGGPGFGSEYPLDKFYIDGGDNYYGIEKHFQEVGYIDLIFIAEDFSNGLPNGILNEVFIDEYIHNETGITWTDYHMELGYANITNFSEGGTECDAVGFGCIDYLYIPPTDEDIGLYFTDAEADPFAETSDMPDNMIWFDGGTVPSGESFEAYSDFVLPYPNYEEIPEESWFTYEGEDTISGYAIVLRQSPSIAASVPEPSIIALFAAGLFGLGFARRRKA